MSAAKRDESIYRDPRRRMPSRDEMPGLYPKINLRLEPTAAPKKRMPLAERVVCWLLRR